MSLIKYNPRNFGTLGVDRFFSNFLNDNFLNGESTSASFVPQVDIAETDKAFEIQFVVPGISKDSFTLELVEGRLTVSGERKFEGEKKDKNFHSVESKYGSFTRSFYLPDNISEDKVTAEYQDGILNISVPKDANKIQKRSIAIK